MREAAQIFHNHLFRCKQCYAPANRYCEDGRALKIDAMVEYIASLPTEHDRRREYLKDKASYPAIATELASKLKEKLELMRSGKNMADQDP